MQSSDFEGALAQLQSRPARQVINPLLSLLCNDDEEVRWKAVRAIGAIVARLADQDRQGARIIMRRLMWTLNEESGGIGWGAPEAMGEIMARDERFAEEYASILVSYLHDEGNFLEHEPLQPGLLWALARVGSVRPDLVKSAQEHLPFYLESLNPAVRGNAVVLVGILKAERILPKVWSLLNDDSEIGTRRGGVAITKTIKELAEETIAEFDDKEGGNV